MDPRLQVGTRPLIISCCRRPQGLFVLLLLFFSPRAWSARARARVRACARVAR